MPANNNPIFGLTPQNGAAQAGAVVGTSANTATDGTGANTYLIFTAGTNGSYATKVVFKPISTVAATVARLWLLNDTGSFVAGTTNTAAKTFMLGEVTLVAWTASNTTASPHVEFALNLPMAASTKILVTFGTSTGAGTTGYNPFTVAMDY